MWKFNERGKLGLNPVLLRTTTKEPLDKSNISVVFELLLYYKQGVKVNEVSCGFASEKLEFFSRDFNGVFLKINGGSPEALITIEQEDVKRTKRTGFKGVMKMLGGEIKTGIKISVKQGT